MFIGTGGEKLRFRINSSSLHPLNYPDTIFRSKCFYNYGQANDSREDYPCAPFFGSAPVIHVFPDNLKLRIHTRKGTSILMGLNYVVRNATAQKFTLLSRQAYRILRLRRRRHIMTQFRPRSQFTISPAKKGNRTGPRDRTGNWFFCSHSLSEQVLSEHSFVSPLQEQTYVGGPLIP